MSKLESLGNVMISTTSVVIVNVSPFVHEAPFLGPIDLGEHFLFVYTPLDPFFPVFEGAYLQVSADTLLSMSMDTDSLDVEIARVDSFALDFTPVWNFEGSTSYTETLFFQPGYRYYFSMMPAKDGDDRPKPSATDVVFRPYLASIEATDAVKEEGNNVTTEFTFKVTLSAAPTIPLTIDWAVTGSGGNPASPDDFADGPTFQTLVFNTGETTKTVTIRINGDFGVEADEQFTVALSNPTVGLGIWNGTAEGTIQNDDSFVVSSVASIAALSAAKTEGSSGTTPFTFTVSLNHAGDTLQVVSWSVTGSGANAADAADFGGALPSGILAFAPGETAKTVAVLVLGDMAVELDEGFTVTLSNASAGLTLGAATVGGTIENDDISTVSIAAQSAVKAEGSGGTTSFTFKVSLNQAGAASQMVAWSVAGSGADPADAADFGGTLPSGMVRFDVGEISKTVTVLASGDTTVERDEGFTVTLSSASADLALGTATAGGTIENDDGSTVPRASVLVQDKIGGYGSYADLIRTDVSYALDLWLASLGAFWNDQASLEIDVSIVQVEPSDRADGASSASSLLFSGGGRTYYQQGATAEILSGIDPNGSVPDVVIRVDPDFIDAWLYFDPNPSPTSPVPASKRDAVGIFVHELGHAFGFSGWLDQNSALPTQLASSTFDYFVEVHSGIPYFVGPKAVALYGGPVPLTKGNLYHLGNDPGPGSDLSGDIMYGPGGFTGKSAGPSALDAAIMEDCMSIASISISPGSATRSEGNSGVTAYEFTLTLTGGSTAVHSISWSVTGSGLNPVDAADFSGGFMPSGTVTFAVGQTTTVIAILVAGDATAELDEEFTISLENPSPELVIATGFASGTIENDDSLAVSSVSIAAQSAVKAEGSSGTTPFTFTVNLSHAGAAPQAVSWAVTGSGASPAGAADFGGALPSGTVTFAAGETTQTVTVLVPGDATVETDDFFTVTLSDPSAGLSLGTASALGIIQNDDRARISITPLTASQPEGDGGTVSFTFTVSLDQASFAAQAANWSVAGTGGNAVDAADFGSALPSGTVSFAIGETSKVVTVLVTGDVAAELNEDFAITLSTLSSGLLPGTASAIGTIQNDDLTVVSIAALSAVKAEGSSGTTPFTFAVVLDQAGVSSQTVAWSLAGSGADPASPADFAGSALNGGTLTFSVGETSKTITVDVVGDTTVEPDEEFTVSLSSPSAGLGLGAASASGTVRDDDATVSIAALSAVKVEGNGGTTPFTFMVTVTGGTPAARSVDWVVSGTGAAAATAADFAGGVLPSGTLRLVPGETSKVLTVSVAGDAAVEADEGFLVALSNPSQGLAIGTASAGGTIRNDDAAVIVVTHDDAYIIQAGQFLSVATSAGVLMNDESASTASLLTGPTHGTLQLAGNGGFSYSPAPGFSGIDSFTYHAATGGSGGDGQALVYVVPVNTGASTTLDLLGLTAEEQIAATYTAFFGRAADAGGHDFWVGEFVRGLPTQGKAALFANIASSFGISAEAKALYPFLVDPFGASDAQISAFLDSVYNNLFNRSSDAGGLAYWTGEIKVTLQAGQFVGSVLVNIMSGAQDTAAGQDITTLMGKVTVSLAYVRAQQEASMPWGGTSDVAAATALLDSVTLDPMSVLIGVRNAETLVGAHT